MTSGSYVLNDFAHGLSLDRFVKHEEEGHLPEHEDRRSLPEADCSVPGKGSVFEDEYRSCEPLCDDLPDGDVGQPLREDLVLVQQNGERKDEVLDSETPQR